MAAQSVTKEGMEAAARRMEEAKRLVNAEKKDVNDKIIGLTGSFTGEAARTYRGAMQGWYDNVDAINKALQEMIDIMLEGAQAVSTAGTTTTNTAEAAAKSMASSYSGGLKGL